MPVRKRATFARKRGTNGTPAQRMDQPVRDDRVEAGIREHHVEPVRAPPGRVRAGRANRRQNVKRFNAIAIYRLRPRFFGGAPLRPESARTPPSGPYAIGSKPAAVQQTRVHRADANENAVVPEQRKKQLEGRPRLARRSTPCVPPPPRRRGRFRTPHRSPAVVPERQAAQLRLVVDVLSDRVQEKQHVAERSRSNSSAGMMHDSARNAETAANASAAPSTARPYASRNVSIQRHAAGGTGSSRNPHRCIAAASCAPRSRALALARAKRRHTRRSR